MFKKLLTALAISATLLLPVVAQATILFPTGGGTGSSSLTGILIGNGVSPLNTLTVGSGLTLTGTTLTSTGGSSTFGTTSIFATTPLQWNTTTATLSILQAGLAQNGFLSSTDFNTFNNKISSSSLSGASVISYTSGTGVITTSPGTFGGSGTYTFPGAITVNGGYTQVGSATNNINGPIKFGTGAYFIGNAVNGFVINNNSDTLNLVQFYPSGGGAIGIDYANNGSDPGQNNFIVEGKIGIGTTTPSKTLSIQGDELLSGNFFGSNIMATGTLTLSALTGTQCLHEISGVVSGTGSDCGSGSGGVTSVTGTYPIISSGGTTPVISTAFSTTTNWGIGNNGIVVLGPTGIPFVAASSTLNLPYDTFAYPFPSGATSSVVSFTNGINALSVTGISGSNLTIQAPSGRNLFLNNGGGNGIEVPNSGVVKFFPASSQGVAIIDPISSQAATFDTSLLSGSDKTFTFPNTTGTLCLTTTCTGTTYTGTFPISVIGSAISSLFSTTTNTGVAQGNLYVGSGGIFQTSATGTVSNGTGISVTAGQSVLGSGLTITNTSPLSGLTTGFPLSFTNPALSWIGLATSSNLSQGGALYATGANTFASTPTTTVSCTGNATCSAFTVFGSSPFTINVAAGTAASSTLLGDSNTFSGALNQFSNTIKVASLGGFIGGNGGTLYNFATSTIKTSQLTNDANFLTANQTITLTGAVTGSGATAITTAFGTAGANTVLSNGTGATAVPTFIATSSLFQNASASASGLLTSTDWSTFNSKQAAGNYITALTGDVTATGPNSVAATLATVNSNVGTFTYPSVTVNGKGLVTAISNGTAPTTYTGTFPINVTGSTISFGGLSTTTNLTQGFLPYITGVNTFGQVATTTISCAGTASCTPFVAIGASPVTITGTGGSGTVTSVTGTYPILSTGGTTPVISTAFGTSTTIGIGNNLFLYTNASGVIVGAASSSLSLPNTALQNSAITINGVSTSLGGSNTITANTTNALTFNNSGSGASSGTTFNGGSAQTISYNTIGAQPTIALGAGTVNSSASNVLYTTATSTITNGSGIAYTGTMGSQIGGVSGTLSVAGLSGTNFSNVGANTVFANGTGASAAPTFVATSTFFGTPTPGTILAFLNGQNTFVATTTFSSGLAYLNGNVTNTGVTSNVAGTGISVSGATDAVTVTNTGVISNSCSSGISCSGTNPSSFTNTGVTSIVAGTNVTISGATGAVTINATGGGSSFGYPFTNPTEFGTTTAATTTPIWAQGGLFASSTSVIASTTFTINGNVGIGTSSPVASLTIASKTSTDQTPALVIDGATGSFNADMQLNRGSNTGTEEANIDFATAGIVNYQLGIQNNSTSDFELWDGSNDPVFTVKNGTNNIGFGTSTPFGDFAINADYGDVLPGNLIFNVASSSLTATTSLFNISNTGVITTQLGNALILSGGVGTALSVYGGAAACTNQVVTAFSATGATTCSTVSDAMLASTFVKTLTVAGSNGFAGSFTAGATPVLTISTSITGLLKGNGTAIGAASNGTDFTLVAANTCSAGQFFQQATAAGVFTCGTPTGGGSAFPFTPTNNFGINTNATSTTLSLFAGLNASSTSHIASTTFDVTGFVGVGTSTNAYGASKFATVISNAVASLGGLLINTATNVTNAFSIINAAGTTVFNVDTTATNPFLGIGTTTPWATASIVGDGTDPVFAVSTSTSNNVLPNFEIDAFGHVLTSGLKPTCTTSCTFGQGNDNAFRITTGTAVTSEVITFSHSWGTLAPICQASEGNNTAVPIVIAASTTPTTVTITNAALTSKDIDVLCQGIQ